MTKSVLFNLQFIQSKKWAVYHGGSENDFTVLLSVLKYIGNDPDWHVYGYYLPDKSFVHDIQSLLSAYSNFTLITGKELQDLSVNTVFQGIYSSDLMGLEWLQKYNLKSVLSLIVIHGIRRYELQVYLHDLLLPNRPRDKVFIIKNYFVRWWMKKNIEKQHQKLISQRPEHVHLVATSQDTKNKILVMCPQLKNNDIHTLYTSQKTPCPSSIPFQIEEEQLILKKFNLVPYKYFLLVSLGRLEKNIYFALNHLHQTCMKHNIPFETIACGETKRNFLVDRLKKKAHIIVTGYVPEKELRVLYKYAYLFIYPTRSEGFGMPILEAMEHGTPVLCTALSPLIEVGGEAAEYFGLGNSLEFCSKIIKFYRDPGFYEEKRKLAIARYQQLSKIQLTHLEEKTSLILDNSYNQERERILERTMIC
ncbi:glycosyltransferase [Legionella longbeachae]|uniref:glycosyltransferase n=1 Tax=Legionella longbeachae TaxID=450 RepID=UPI0012471B3D|nr:glycosyltransferase [Legionella longbeachae]QEY52867.1 glycosyltransferase family 4 protein [Legionella longbeachae]